MEDPSDVDFIHYLQETLIPDLKDSGLTSTAEDFERCIEIITTEERWLEIKEAGLVRE